MVVEVMGRNAGWIALASGLAGGANVIILPEISWKWDSIFALLRERSKNRVCNSNAYHHRHRGAPNAINISLLNSIKDIL